MNLLAGRFGYEERDVCLICVLLPGHNIYNCLSLPPLYQSIQVVEGLETE